METDNSKVPTVADKVKVTLQSAMHAVLGSPTTALPSNSRCQERPPDNKRREEDTGPRAPWKFPRTSGGADTGEISRDNHGKVEETGGILLEGAGAELNESPHISVSTIFHKATNGTIVLSQQ